MAIRGVQQAAVAAASDGSVLINVVELLPEAVRAQLTKALGSSSLFVGVPLSEREAADVVARLDGAAAEASARLLATRARAGKPAKSSARRPAKRR